MVNNCFRKIMVGIVLTIILVSKAFPQNNNRYPELKKFSHWSLVAGPALYEKGKVFRQYGEYTFENRPMWGYNAGFEYDLFPDRKWSFKTGLIIAIEPVYSIKYSIKKEDTYPQFIEDWDESAKSYGIISFSTPLLAKLNLQIEKTCSSILIRD